MTEIPGFHTAHPLENPPVPPPGFATPQQGRPDGEPGRPGDVLHVGLLSFEMDCGTLRIFRQWQGERLDCGSFHMLPEEFGALGAWLVDHAEAAP